MFKRSPLLLLLLWILTFLSNLGREGSRSGRNDIQTAEGLFDGALTFTYMEILRANVESAGITDEDCDIGWPSKLCEKHLALHVNDEHYLVIGEGSWAMQVIRLHVAEGIFQSATFVPHIADVRGSYGVLSIMDPMAYQVSRVRGCLVPGDSPQATGTLGLEAISERTPLLLWALRERKDFSLFMLQHCAEKIPGAKPPAQTYSRIILIGHLATALGVSPEEVAQITESYKKARPPPPEEDGLDDEPELADLLEEMAISDQINQQDLKSYRDDIKARTTKKLVQMRNRARQEHAAAAAKAKAKAKRRKASVGRKARNFKHAKSQLRQARNKINAARPGPAAPPDPNPPGPSSGDPPPPAPPPPVPVPDARENRPASSSANTRAAPRPPQERQGWRRLNVPTGGWLLHSESLGRLDAHCPAHAGCRMNSTLRKGPLGLCLAWLGDASVHTPEDKEGHDVAKEVLSSAASFKIRREARARFESYAAGGLPDSDRFLAVMRQEADIRNAVSDEPAFLACPPSTTTRALRSA